jgi:hypothetical protein
VSKEEYPYQKYPPFCQGAFYLFQLHIAKKFCQLFEMELQRNFVWMEDVFFTGALHLQTILYLGCKQLQEALKNCIFYQAVIRQSSGSCQAVVRQLSGSCQAVVRQLSGSCQAVVRQSSGSLHAVINQSSVISWAAYVIIVAHCTTS